MATRVLPFTVTIPAGTPENAPVTIPLAFDNWDIERIDLEVPPGPAGLMGFQLLNNGVAWIPYGAGQWLVWDDVRESYYMTDQPAASGWAIQGYNTGFFNHSVIVRMHVNPTSPPTADATTTAVTIVSGEQAPTEPITFG